ncbi:hypothetical protein P5Y53_08765 [Dyella jiangningensis]|uniref:hypothetical protein n=1 Tax=Dyella jiangningensis TaxID=1379159 RepID=UPI0024109EF2|nr:hypothetical protein [Dyella jiangningensis]MDG2537749.1 hypothetical protein [Dyella jiangningensis]
MSPKISNFTMHDALGNSVLVREWLQWVRSHNGPGDFGVTTHYTWSVDGNRVCVPVDIAQVTWNELPDASGFICFEKGFRSDNCYVLDAYGNERYRLRVPWEQTPYDVPAGAKMWFRNVGTHNDGQFGVAAWIEFAGDFYFELDYHEGCFLWGKEIRF